MPEEMIQIHNALGISDKRSEEIAEEVIDVLTEAGRMDTGAKTLAGTYNAEALLAGMRLMQAIQMNNRLDQYKEKRKALRRPKHPSWN